MNGAGFGISSHVKWFPTMAVEIFVLRAKRSLELARVVSLKRVMVMMYGFDWEGGGVQARERDCLCVRFVNGLVKPAAAWWMGKSRGKSPAVLHFMAGEG
jgi:hypothetical protein